MYVDTSSITLKGVKHTRHLLRTSFREDGKVKHKTIANLSACTDEEIEAIRLALRHKGDLKSMLQADPELENHQGLAGGGVWTLFDIARQMGIEKVLGDTRQGRLALWQVIARLLDQGSRLSAVRLARAHAACDVLGLKAFNEDDLYENLDWLSENQERIEKAIGAKRVAKGGLFLYDVTSSYLEGVKNEYGAFGYNRDGKKGKMQIVIGLLCDEEGDPLSVQVFDGKTQDTKTFQDQIRKAVDRFGGGAVTFVGDRGMIKSPQIKDLAREGFHYITAITKAQIQTLLRHGTLQMELFDLDLAEVFEVGGVRYVLRRNPVRAQEIAALREDKLAALRKSLEARNAYLAEHPRAHVETALNHLRARAESLNIAGWAKVLADEATRILSLELDEAARAEEAKLDGCYVLKTDLDPQTASKETVHARYKDLAKVEQAFRTSKQVELELRPIHVRLAAHTRAHVLVVMLAYRIARVLSQRWRDLDTRVQEGLNELSGLCATEVRGKGGTRFNRIPQPRESVGRLLQAAQVCLPKALPYSGVVVSTKRTLVERRVKR
jgi:hypothetical protein